MKIISGGQTGVDRAALDAAIALGIDHGGWCPAKRRAEKGTVIPSSYQLTATSTSDYNERTLLNIEYADGSLILVPSHLYSLTGGTLFSQHTAIKLNKPCLLFYLNSGPDKLSLVTDWVTEQQVFTLNIAGPRESESPGIYQDSLLFLKKLFNLLLG